MTPKQKKITVFVAIVAIVLAIAIFSSPLAALSSLAQALGMAFVLGLGVGVGRYAYAAYSGKRKATDDLPNYSQIVAGLTDCQRWIAVGGLVAVIGVALAGGLPWWGWLALIAACWMAVAAAPVDIYGIPMSAYSGAALIAGAGGATLAWLAQHQGVGAESGDPNLAAAFISGAPLMVVAAGMSLAFHADRQRTSAPAVAVAVPRQDPPRMAAPAPVQAPPTPANDEAARVREMRNQQQRQQREQEEKRQAEERQAEADRKRKVEQYREHPVDELVRKSREEEAQRKLLDPRPSAPTPTARATQTSVKSSALVWSSHLPPLSIGLAEAVQHHLPNSEVAAAAIAQACESVRAVGPHVWVLVGPSGTSKRWLAEVLPSWLDAAWVPMAEKTVPQSPMVIAVTPTTDQVAAISQALDGRVGQSNPYRQTLIVMTIDADVSGDDPVAAARRTIGAQSTVIAELGEIIPVSGPQGQEDWTYLAMVMLERQAGVTTTDRLQSLGGKVVAYAKTLPGGLSNTNLLLAINKLAVH